MEAIWRWLTTPPTAAGVLDPVVTIYVVIVTIGFVVSAYLAGPGIERLGLTTPQRPDLMRRANTGMWVFGAALVVFGVRALQIDALTLGAPIWLLLSAIGVVVYIISTARWWRGWRAVNSSIREADAW